MLATAEQKISALSAEVETLKTKAADNADETTEESSEVSGFNFSLDDMLSCPMQGGKEKPPRGP